MRVTKPGGRILVTAWALEQEGDARRVFEGADVWVPFKTPGNVKKELEARAKERAEHRPAKIIVKDATVKTEARPDGDLVAEKSAVVEDTKDAASTPQEPTEDPAADTPNLPPPEDCARFYHVFRQGEMEELVESVRADGVPVETERVFYDKGNWCIIMRRLPENKE